MKLMREGPYSIIVVHYCARSLGLRLVRTDCGCESVMYVDGWPSLHLDVHVLSGRQ